MNRALGIILGLTIIYTVSLVLVLVFQTLFIVFVKKQKIKLGRLLGNSIFLAFVNLFVTLGSIAVFAFNRIVFSFLSFLLIGLGYFLLFKYLWKYETKEALILSFGMALILNPAWLIPLGLL